MDLIRIMEKSLAIGLWPGVPVLTDISLEAKPGQTIALVGATGSGKTTTISLLSRFYDIEDGHICADGVDIRKIRRESLRRALGIVRQDSQLFSNAAPMTSCSPKTAHTQGSTKASSTSSGSRIAARIDASCPTSLE